MITTNLVCTSKYYIHLKVDIHTIQWWKVIGVEVLPLRYLGDHLQYIPRNMHTVFALLCFVVVIHWLIFPYPSGLLHWHCGNLRIAPVPAKQPWWIWINTSWEFIMNDCITTTKQSTTKPCAYFLGYTVCIKPRPYLYWNIDLCAAESTIEKNNYQYQTKILYHAFIFMLLSVG